MKIFLIIIDKVTHLFAITFLEVHCADFFLLDFFSFCSLTIQYQYMFFRWIRILIWLVAIHQIHTFHIFPLYVLMHELCNIVGNKSGYKICTCTEGISYYSMCSLVMLCKAIYGESIEGWGCLAATNVINSPNIHNKLNSFWMKGKAIRYNDHHLYFKTLSHFSSSVNIVELLKQSSTIIESLILQVNKRWLFIVLYTVAG